MASDSHKIRSEEHVKQELVSSANWIELKMRKTFLILTTFINDVNKSDNIFGKLTNEERTLAHKKLMSESLLNYSFHGTALSQRTDHLD